MQLPPVHSISLSEYFVSGNVIIHETAVIAPGVILEAAPDCQIIIDAGVCLGLGCVITAQVGNIRIQEQVAIAPGSLIIGPVNIGSSACIGARSTIFQQDIESQALISPGSLLINSPVNQPHPPPLPIDHSPDFPQVPERPEPMAPIPSPWDSENLGQSNKKNSVNQAVKTSEIKPKAPTGEEVELSAETSETEVFPGEVTKTEPLEPEGGEIIKEKPPVVGQVYINQLLLTLFPERRYFNS